MNRLLLCLLLIQLLAVAEEHSLPATVSDGAKPVEVYSANIWFEGPAWDKAAKKLYFTAYFKKDKKPVTQILRLDEPGKVTVWMDNAKDINGTCLGQDGRLYGAQNDTHSIVSMKIGADGPEDFKAVFHDDKLNQPNDVRQAPNGDFYFTDPEFKTHKSAVYLLKADGKATPIISDLPAPNGITVSNDGKTLYVSDSEEKAWHSYPIKADGTVGEGKLFFKPEKAAAKNPDGMTIDENGNLYCTGCGGLWVVTPEGKELGFLPFTELTSNCCFGGEDGKTLFITCGNKVYSLQMKVRGALFK
jgi:gluconolactonase